MPQTTDVCLTGLSSIDDEKFGRYTVPQSLEGIANPPEKIFIFRGECKPSEAAAASIANTLNASGISREKVQFLISASSTPDFNNPSLAQCALAQFPGWSIGGIEIRQSAAGFDYAIGLAKNLVKGGIYESIIVVATEFLSRNYAAFSEDAPRSQSIEYARAVSGDGVVSCLVCSGRFLAEHKITSPAFSVIKNLNLANGNGAAAFTTPVPSTSRMPLRMSPKDLRLNEHLPRIDREQFLRFTREGFGEEIKAASSWAESIVVNAPAADFLSACGIRGDTRRVYDAFISRGYCGAAGSGLGLLALTAERKLGAKERVVTISAGAGINLGATLLEAL